MPGANCSIFGCSTSRKRLGIALFRVPTGNNEWSTKWRNKIVDVITRDRVVDKYLKRQIESRTTRVPGAIPSINLPVKSVPPGE